MKLGDYVRTEYGIIGKITKIIGKEKGLKDCYLNFKNMAVYGNETDYIVVGNRGKIIKSSTNIIDLIEVGDYANGCPVLHKENNELVCGLLLRYKEENIQNVVTKEQFKSMEYKVGAK